METLKALTEYYSCYDEDSRLRSQHATTFWTCFGRRGNG